MRRLTEEEVKVMEQFMRELEFKVLGEYANGLPLGGEAQCRQFPDDEVQPDVVAGPVA